MKKTVILTIACLCLINSTTGFAACPSADLSGDCRVDLEDFTIMASEWLSVYDYDDLANMAFQWLDNPFVTTWDTSLGEGTTVTLALAGEVDAVIDWGDDTVETVTTPGPHVHDYGSDGVYTGSALPACTVRSITARTSFQYRLLRKGLKPSPTWAGCSARRACSTKTSAAGIPPASPT